MEPVFLDMAHAESYQYGSYDTYGDSMNYSYEPVQYSAVQSYAQPGYNYQYQNLHGVDINQLMYSEDDSQNAVILVAADGQSGSYESIPNGSIDNESNDTVMSFKSEAEMLDYFSSLGDLKDIKILPIVSEMENTEKYTDEVTGQNTPMEVVDTPTIIENKAPAPVMPAQSAKRKRSTKKSNAPNSRKRTRIVYENSSFVCEPCDRTFGRRSGLIQHNNTHHSGPREHRCAECGKRFHTQDDLQRHIQRHLTVHKPHKCAECPRQFNYHQDLERHITVRHGVAKYECQHCGKRIARRDHLLSHEASHTKKLARELRRNRFQELVLELQL